MYIKRFLYFLSASASFMLFTLSIAMADSASNLFNQGFEQHKRGNLESAVQNYSSAIEENAAFAMAYQMRGIAQQQLKKYAEAINDYSMVISTGEPSFKVVGFYNRGIVKNMTGDFIGAIPDFTQAIELDKKMGAAFFHRGIAKSKTGDLDGRLGDFRQAALLGEINAERWLNTYYPDWKQSKPTPPASLPLPPAPATTTANPS